MKVHTLALAAALAFGGAAFAAPNDTVNSPTAHEFSHSVKARHQAKTHAVRHHTKAVRHAAKHHKAMHTAKRQHMRDHSASVQTDVNSGSREARMEEALRKFRSHG